MKKKILSTILISALLIVTAFSLMACGNLTIGQDVSSSGTTEESQSTSTASDEKMGVDLGTMDGAPIEEMDGDMGTPPELPTGEQGVPPEMNGQQPPEMNGQMPEMNGQQPPEMNGQMPEMNGQQPPQTNGQQPPEMNGQQPPQMNGQQPPQLA
ncbi:MAG: hypothetical protein IJ735_02475 [Clostridia bacterium]|nr:hypothetical protein [Clostridia bacterium]